MAGSKAGTKPGSAGGGVATAARASIRREGEKHYISGEFGELVTTPIVATQGRYEGQTRYGIHGISGGGTKFFDTRKEANAWARDYVLGHIRSGEGYGTRSALRGLGQRFGYTY